MDRNSNRTPPPGRWYASAAFSTAARSRSSPTVRITPCITPADRCARHMASVSGYVNGQSAQLDPKGRFEMKVARSDTVVFRMVGRDGAESYWVRNLRGSR